MTGSDCSVAQTTFLDDDDEQLKAISTIKRMKHQLIFIYTSQIVESAKVLSGFRGFVFALLLTNLVTFHLKNAWPFSSIQINPLDIHVDWNQFIKVNPWRLSHDSVYFEQPFRHFFLTAVSGARSLRISLPHFSLLIVVYNFRLFQILPFRTWFFLSENECVITCTRISNSNGEDLLDFCYIKHRI